MVQRGLDNDGISGVARLERVLAQGFQKGHPPLPHTGFVWAPTAMELHALHTLLLLHWSGSSSQPITRLILTGTIRPLKL